MGFVIGKNGETIKRIQAETGAKVQFNMSKLNHFVDVRLMSMYSPGVEINMKQINCLQMSDFLFMLQLFKPPLHPPPVVVNLQPLEEGTCVVVSFDENL